MIRFQRLTPALLDAWLVSQNLTSTHPSYRLRLWQEDPTAFNAIRDEIVGYFNEALDDARKNLRAGFADMLSPFNDEANDPAANYPSCLHRVTLLGYLGETLGAMAIEHWGTRNYRDWQIPAFLFRFHDQEFQHLDTINERLERGENYNPDDRVEQRPGRTGDDALAFRLDTITNTITDVLTLEAKCLASNNSAKITEAHEKLSNAGRRPSGVHELICLLATYDTPEAKLWQEALLSFWVSGYQTAARYDGVSYACGNRPRQGNRVAWLPVNAPHPSYTAPRSLEAVEFHFEDVDVIINAIYRGGQDGD